MAFDAALSRQRCASGECTPRHPVGRGCGTPLPQDTDYQAAVEGAGAREALQHVAPSLTRTQLLTEELEEVAGGLGWRDNITESC